MDHIPSNAHIPFGTLHLGNHFKDDTGTQIVYGNEDEIKWYRIDIDVFNDFSRASIIDPGPRQVTFDQLELTLVRIIAAAASAAVLHSEYCRLSNGSAIIRIFFVPTISRSSTSPNQSFNGISASRLPHELGCILNHVSTASSHWSGCPADGSSCGNYRFRLNPVYNSLSELYNVLPSPITPLDELHPSTVSIAHLVYEKDRLPGMRSRLHRYQKESVVKMLQKETHSGPSINPLYVSLRDLSNNEIFYFQPTTMDVTREPPLMAQPCGGILSEELGSGKTCMLIALIMLTLYQLPSPEDSLIEPRPVLTPVALRHFQTLDALEARECVYGGRDTISYLANFPTLAALIAHQIRADPDTRRFRSKEERFSTFSFWSEIKRNVPFYLQSSEPGDSFSNRARMSRYPIISPPRRMLLSTATLVIVPPHLFIQWQSEIHKHCEDVLRVLILNSKDSVPEAETLANDFDVVLLSATRFSVEARSLKPDNRPYYSPCRCPSKGITGIPLCVCELTFHHSPLLNIRWKRLIIDEGHVLSNHTSELSTLASRLSAERRWLVSGTPTIHLIGAGLGSQKGIDSAEPDRDQLVTYRNFMSSRTWNSEDRKDMQKLANIFTHFFRLPQFEADRKLFTRSVGNPLLQPTPPTFGAVQVIFRLLSQNMVRHRITHIEDEIDLPPLQREIVLLDMDPFGKKTYNVLQAAIAVNAVDSERTDQDYLFHPSNVQYLKSVISALSQATFWHADPKQFKVDEVLRNAQSSLERAKDRHVSREDCNLLEDSIRYLKDAASDVWWRGILTREDICYRVFSEDNCLIELWSRLSVTEELPFHEKRPRSSSTRDQLLPVFLSADRAVRLRRAFAMPTCSRESIVAHARIAQADDIEIDRRQALSQQKKKSKKNKADELVISPVSGSIKVTGLAQKSREQLNALNNLRTDQIRPSVSRIEGSPLDIPIQHPLPSEVHSSVSAKLNWILREVSRYCKKEKFLIFSASPLTLAHIGDGLDLLGVSYLTFASMTEHKLREQMPVTFETADSCRVMLMELKYGARGLNLTAASRVIFCEPIWHADVESQAVKRAHRIGQTKPIVVKTLAIRATFEEVVLSRRGEAGKNGYKGPSLTEEPGMRAFLKDPHFLEIKSSLEPWEAAGPPLLTLLPN